MRTRSLFALGAYLTLSFSANCWSASLCASPQSLTFKSWISNYPQGCPYMDPTTHKALTYSSCQLLLLSNCPGSSGAITPSDHVTVSASSLLAANIVGGEPGTVGAVQVFWNPSQPPGTYTATVSVYASAYTNSPLIIPVTAIIGTPLLAASPTAISVSYHIGDPIPQPQTISLTSTLDSFSCTIQDSGTGRSWMKLFSSGVQFDSTTLDTPFAISLQVNPVGLPPGTYTSSIAVSRVYNSPNGPPLSQVAPISIPITVTVAATPSLTVSPSALTFTYSPGESSSPPAQLISVGSSGSTLAFSTSASGGSWLALSPPAGTTPATVSVSVKAGGLTPGQYAGTVTITATGASNGPLTVSVKLMVSAAPLPTISLSTNTLTFSYQVGGAVPPSQSVSLSASSAVAFTASTSTPSWLSVTPSAGTTPSTLNASINPSALQPGGYSSSVNVTAPGASNPVQTISVSLTVSPAPANVPTITEVLNAASYANSGISPGEIVVIGGTNLGPATPAYETLDSNGNMSTLAAGVQVLFSGIPAPLIYVSSSQINAVVPYEIAGVLTPSVSVKYQGRVSNAYAVGSAPTAPALFTLNASGTGPAAILNQDNTVNAPTNPASKGSYIVLYVTGEGLTSPSGVTGKVTTVAATPPLTPTPILPVTVIIDAQLVPTAFIGEAPSLVSGVLQINVQIPLNVRSGNLPIVVSVGGRNSQDNVSVSVQ